VLNNNAMSDGILGTLADICTIIVSVVTLLQSDRIIRIIKDKISQSKTQPTARNTYRCGEKESKFNDFNAAINAIKTYTKKWENTKFPDPSYRRQIELQTFDGRKMEIRHHVEEIQRTIKPLQDLKIKPRGLPSTLKTASTTIDRMIELGNQTEIIFQTVRGMKQIFRLQPNRALVLMNEGDSICVQWKTIDKKLQKFRGRI
jgi:hypothetical protein